MNRDRTQKEFLRLYNSLPDDHPRKLDALEKYSKFCGFFSNVPADDLDNVILISHDDNAELQAQRIRNQQRFSQAQAKKL